MMRVCELLANTRRTRQQAMNNSSKKNKSATYVHPSAHMTYCNWIGDGALAKGDGGLAKGDGALAKGDGGLAKGDGGLAKGDGGLANMFLFVARVLQQDDTCLQPLFEEKVCKKKHECRLCDMNGEGQRPVS